MFIDFDRFRYELRLMGKRVILTPILIMIGYLLFAILLRSLKVDPPRFLSSSLEMILPLATAIIVSMTTSQDPAIEVQLTVPRKYHQTVLGRLIIIACWTACIALLSSIVLFATKLDFIPQPITASWNAPQVFFTGLLTWLGPLFWFVGVSFCLGLLVRSRSANAAILSGIWIVEILLKDYFAVTNWLHPVFLFPTTLLPLAGPIPQTYFDLWLSSRLEIIATGLILLPIGWLLLHNPEGLLKGAGEE